MIVKNEERFLEKCLKSVAGVVDEINIVDTGSTDRTVEIAQQFGARVEHHAWRNDFAWARNKSLDMATRRWILQLDADEELLPESIAALERIKSAPSHLTGVWLRCVNSSDRYRGGGTISHAIIRMFPNHERVRFQGAIHEFPSIDGSPFSMTAVTAPIKIVHHGYLADVVADRGKYARNMSIIEQSVRDQPEDAFHWYNLGTTANLNAEYDRAATALEKMWELCKANGMRAFTANGLQILADIYSEHLGDPEKGLTYAQECLERSPRYANAHFSAGKANFLLKRYDEARAMYRLAIGDAQYLDRQFVVDDEVPTWKAQSEIGSTYAEQGDHVSALEWFEKGLANRPNVQPLRINKAKALETLGRLAEAEETFRALYDDFGDEISAVDLVNYWLRHGKERDAVALIERVHARLSPMAGTSMLLAATYVSQKNGWGDGEHYLVQAAQLDPDSAQVRDALQALHVNRGGAGESAAAIAESLAAGLYQDATQRALHAAALHPEQSRFRYLAALALANLGQKVEALEQLEKIGEGAHAEAAWMLRATLQREMQQDAQALESLECVLARNAKNFDALLMKAALAEKSGNTAAAESALLLAVELNRSRASIELAGLYLRSGRVVDAKRIAEQALV